MNINFRNMFPAVFAAMLSATALPAAATLNVFTCEPEWAALALELGGDKVKVTSATTALQDVHHVEARPSLIARARNADLLVCTGAELEIGWLPLLLSQSGNRQIQPGQPGYLEAAASVNKMEVPQLLDRSQGDVHPAGNPHIHLDPQNIAKVGEAITARLMQLDAANAETYKSRATAFQKKWRESMQKWEAQVAPLKGVAVVVYHKDLSYLLRWLGMRDIASLEPKPGVPPTTGHLSEMLAKLQREPAKMILRSAYSDPKAATWLSERAKLPTVTLPYTVGGNEQAKDLFWLFDDSIQRLLAALK
ncbi:MAG: zinc ABC transporter substrate-binding protein [Betaproteobacteria bacterium]|nr:zinc ABC transporter substrate-binding protein [Betaproteobacteria bacterium]